MNLSPVIPTADAVLSLGITGGVRQLRRELGEALGKEPRDMLHLRPVPARPSAPDNERLGLLENKNGKK